MFITVTKSDNLITHEDGSFELKDPSIIGRLVKLHTLTATQINQKTGTLETGAIVKGEVYWEHDRSLAGCLCDVHELSWINFQGDEIDQEFSENDQNDDEDNEFYGEPDETSQFDN